MTNQLHRLIDNSVMSIHLTTPFYVLIIVYMFMSIGLKLHVLRKTYYDS